MRNRIDAWRLFRVAAMFLVLGVPLVGSAGKGSRPRVELSDARLKIELNDTDGDAGIQVFVDGDPWKSMEIFDTRGRRLLRVRTSGAFGKQGGAELFMESGEPSFDELSFEDFLERFPEGDYHFRGRGVDGERFFGTAELTHDIPNGPLLVSPLEGGPLVDSNDAVMRWEPVADPPGSRIIAYQMLVVLPDGPVAWEVGAGFLARVVPDMSAAKKSGQPSLLMSAESAPIENQAVCGKTSAVTSVNVPSPLL